ncbi:MULTISPECIES: hypothetical protein [Bacillus]|uniref:hypothetical protein n=1 Tax=Bacillus TaxID=1386 RepID=UPI00036E2CD7|nr:MULTISPECIES: hypothetical protein [Bacillus]
MYHAKRGLVNYETKQSTIGSNPYHAISGMWWGKASTDNKSKVEAKQENKKVKLSKEDSPNKVYELCLDYDTRYLF